MDEALTIEAFSSWFFIILFLGGILFVGLFNVVIYYVRQLIKAYYYFGMICVFYFIWFICSTVDFDIYVLHFMSEDIKMMISVLSSNRMVLFFMLYMLHIFVIRKPLYEKGIKIGANILFIFSLFMPFSVVYADLIMKTNELFNLVAQLYVCYEVVKIAIKLRKDVRIINALAYVVVCLTAVIQLFNIPFHEKTISLAFILIALQAIILALHYNKTLIEAEMAKSTLEIKVKERTAELVRKEEETNQLITSISHDLRTPISVVGGYMELLKSDISISQDNQQFISNSLVRLLQMEKLTIDLFTLSQMNDKSYQFNLGRVNISEMIEKVVELYAEQAKDKAITLRTDIEGTWWCWADEMRVVQVLDNLMMNALAYANSTIAITVHANDGGVKVSVVDDGPGVHLDELPFVFDRFYKRRQRGSGIGLSNVKELIQRMGGKVAVQNVPQAGASFMFTLPIIVDE